MTDTPFSFNLWHEPWIRVMRPDGESETLGIGACLRQAHTLHALHDPSPLVVAGVHRLLTAILQFVYQPNDLDDLEALLEAGQFDPDRLEQFAALYAERFDLFHPTAPFLQTGDVAVELTEMLQKDAKPVSYLFAEIPSATNRSHFHHVTDDSHRLCPACCACGLVMTPAFASSGGPGIRPSINGVPPVYILPASPTLFETLALSLVGKDYQPRTAHPERAHVAWWNGPTTLARNVQVSAVGYLESLTFAARRMRLFPQYNLAACTNCGDISPVTVSFVLFEMGLWLSEGSEVWDDPFAAFRKPKSRSKVQDAGPKPVRPEAGKALWREYSGLLLAESDEQFRPRIVRQIARLVDRDVLRSAQAVQFRCIALRTDGKAKVFEWIDESLEAPPALLNDSDAAGYVDRALEQADGARFILESTFDGHFRPERGRGGYDQKLARFKTIRARMTAGYWQALAPLFRLFIRDLETPETRDAIAKRWVGEIIREGRSAFITASSQVGERAEALRARVEAEAECSRRLMAKRKEWMGDTE